MFRTRTEQQIARLRYLDGLTQEQIALALGISQPRVSKVLAMFAACFRQLGIRPDSPDDTRDAVTAMLRRAA